MEAVGPTRLPRILDSLRYRDFRLLWTTTALSAAARNLQQISLGWLAYDLTGSGVWLGTVLFIYQVPFLGLSLLIGVWTDRLDRRKLLAASQFVMAGLAVLLAVGIAAGWVRPWHLMVFAFASGVENAIIHIVRQALVPRLVPRASLMNAVSLNTTAFNVMRIATPTLGGALIVAIGVAGNFGIQAVLLLGVALATLPMHVGKAEGAEQLGRATARAVAGEMAAGVRYVWTLPALRRLVGVQYLATFFVMPFVSFLPAWSTDVLHADADILGALYAATGVGSLAGTLVLAQMGAIRRGGLLLLGSIAANAAGLMVFALATPLWATLVVLAFLGVVQIVFFTVNMTSVQGVAPDRLQGRVMSVYNLGHGSAALGTLAMGVLVETLGVRWAMAVMGMALAALTVIVWAAAPSIWRTAPREAA